MDIRPSPIAGRWYPADASRLAQSIDGYLEAAQVEAPPGAILGVIVPHAGHLYSGPVAAYAYQALRGLPAEVVAVLCPSHFHADGALLTTRHAAYSTPLGTVPVDRGALEALAAELKSGPGGEPLLVELGRDREHAIEIQLPFLQRVLPPGFQLIPVMLRDQTPPGRRRWGRRWPAGWRAGAPWWWAAPTCLTITRGRWPISWIRRCCGRWRISIRRGC